MEHLKKLKEERGTILSAMEAMQTEIRSAGVKMTDEQRTSWKKHSDDLADVDERIAVEEQMRDAMISKANDDEKRGKQTDLATREEQRAAMINFLNTGEVRAKLNIQSGEYIIPSFIYNAIEKALKSFGGVLSVADVMTTATGAPLNFPTVNDTGSSATIIEEGEEVTIGDSKTIGNVTIKAFTYATKVYPISKELIQDSAFDIEGLIVELLTDSFHRGFNKHLTIGDGAKEPQGVVTASTKGVDATEDALTYKNLIDLMFSVDAAYQVGGSWMFNSQTLSKIMTITDTAGQLIFQPSLRDEIPGKILNKPYVINEDMPSIGAGEKSVLFGNFKKYKVRVVRNFECSRLVEAFARQRCIGFLGFARMDARLIDAGTHPVKHLLHAGVKTVEDSAE